MNQGRVKIFKIENGEWTLFGDTSILVGDPSAGNDYGHDIELSSNGLSIIVGEPGYDMVKHTYIFIIL